MRSPSGSCCARRAAGLAQRGLRPLAREAALQQQRTQHVLDVVGRAQPLDDARTAAGALHDHELARLHRLPGAPAERELLALVEERLRDEKAPAALHDARDELWPAFLVDHRSTRDGHRVHEQLRLHGHVRAHAAAVDVEPVGRAVGRDGELDGAAAGARRRPPGSRPCRTSACRRSSRACSRSAPRRRSRRRSRWRGRRRRRAACAAAPCLAACTVFAEHVSARVRDDVAALRGRRRPSSTASRDQSARVAAQVEHHDRRVARGAAHLGRDAVREARDADHAHGALGHVVHEHGVLRDRAARDLDEVRVAARAAHDEAERAARAAPAALRAPCRGARARAGRRPRAACRPCGGPARAAGDFGTTPTIAQRRAHRAHPHADAVEALARYRLAAPRTAPRSGSS